MAAAGSAEPRRHGNFYTTKHTHTHTHIFITLGLGYYSIITVSLLRLIQI